TAEPTREYKPLLRGAHGKPEEVSVTKALLGENQSIDIRLTEEEGADKPFLQIRNIRTQAGLNLALKLQEKGFIKGTAAEFQEGKTTAELTPAGIKAAKQLRINRELEQEGLPMKHYRPSTSRKIPTTYRKEILVAKNKWDGETVFSDGRFALKGQLDLNTPKASNRPDMDPIIADTPTRKKGEEYAEAIAFTKDSKDTNVILISGDGEAFEQVNGELYDFMLKRYPDGKFFLGKKKGKPISFYSKNKKVGILMPMRTDWDENNPRIMKGVLDQINQFRQKIGKKTIKEPGDLKVTTEGAAAPKLSIGRKTPKPLKNEAPNATKAKPASRESLESVPAVSPGKAKPRANTRGIKAGELITKLTLNDASSIYREAFKVAGRDPEIMVNRPIGEQFDVLEKMMKDEFGFKFIQRSKDDPQGAVNALLDAYRSLSFMTYTLGLPKQAIGLQGELGLALPGKDWGRYFAAYYAKHPFPIKTKSDLPPMKSPFIIMPNRPNSFAHEYGHALDFFLMDKLGADAAAGLTQVIRQAERFESPYNMNAPVNLQEAMGQLMGALFFEDASHAAKIMQKEQQLSKQIAAYEKKLEKNPNMPEPKSIAETREDLVRLRSGAARSPKESVYRRTSTDFAKQTGSDPNYWREPTEMFARAFEAYVAHIVTQAGGTTKFTALPDAAYKMTLQEVEGYDIRLPLTHPQESERNRVFLAFNNLFDVLRETSLSDGPLFPGSRTEKPEGLDTVDITSEFKPIPEPQVGSKAANEKARRDINAAIRQTNREKQRPGRFDNLKAGPKYIENLYEYVFSRTLQSKRGSLLTLMKRYGDNPKAKAALEEIFSKVATDPGGKGRVTTKGGTFEEATNRELRRFSQVYRSITERHDMKSLSDSDRILLRRTLTGRERNPPEHIKKLAADLRNKLLIPAFDYAKRKGVRIRYLEDGAYLPRIMDNALVFSNERKFLNQAYKLYKNVIFENDFGFPPDTHNWDQLKDLKTLTRRKQFKTRLEGDENIEEFWKDVEELKRLEKLLDNEDGSVAEKAEDDIAELEDKIDEYYEELYKLINETYADINSKDWLFRIHQMSGMDPAAHPPMGRFTKKRTLPSEADEIMAEFYLDVEDSLLSYIPAVVRKAEYEQRFGGSLVPKGKKLDPVTGQRRDYLNYILDEKMAGEIDPDDRQHIRYMVQVITGTQGPVADIPFQKFGNWVHALGTMSLLGRAAWSAIAEPLTAGIQAQSVRKGFKAFGLSLYEAYALLPVDDAKQKVNLNKELANILGIISDPEVGELSANRLGGTFADDPKMAKRVNRFFSVTKLQGITNAQRRSTMRIGFEFMKSLSNDFLDPQAKNAENRAKVKRRAKRLLNEFGINDDDMKQFAEFMRDGGQLPEVSDLVNDDGSLSDMGELTAVAVGRFVDQSIQDPKSVDRPKFAEHPLGRIIYGIQSFIYAFHRNVLTRAIK
ncbi:MAG: LPD1 domain-containing protein, partial [bacterium]